MTKSSIPSTRVDANDARSSLIHREIIQLAALIAVAVGAFFLTRAIAASNREMTLRDAAEWYQRGQRQLDNGETAVAVDSFRRATLKNRDDKQYVLALANALARTHQYEAARSALLALRESAPEDPTINLELARLAVDRQDVTEATRYYHNALYAPWPVDQAAARREVRLELVRFLLTHSQVNRALSELQALTADLPEDAAAHVQVAQLFSAAGDSPHALDQFQRALRIAPETGAALAGAGQAAFRMADYAAARKLLRTAPDDIAGVAETREIVDVLMSSDPLASRLGLSARRQRLMDSIAYADQRLMTCLEHAPGGQADAEAETMRHEAQAFAEHLQRSRTLEADTIEAGVELADRIAQRVLQTCPPATPHDRALILIARLHGVEQR
jgi:tetratricopeptide (TPR) repeat protein